MKFSIKKFIASCLACMTAVSCFSFVGCSTKKEYKRKELHYGLGDVSYELQSLLEPCCTSDYLSDVCGGFGVDTFRIWMGMNYMINREQNSDEVSLNPTSTQAIHTLVKRMNENGVTRLIGFSSDFIYPFDYTPTTYCCVPDPISEKDFYLRFLNIQEKCFELLAEEFKGEIEFFECINEPDMNTHPVIHKNGYSGSASANANSAFYYTDEENARICMDICYYVNRGIKRKNENADLLAPALCAYTVSQDFLDTIYKVIESETLPTGTEYSVTDPDEYFDILNWHPYILANGARTMGEEWVKYQKDMFSIAVKHNDGDKPVWFTEIGFSDSEIGEDEAKKRLEQMFPLIDKLKFIDTVIVFRITNLYATDISAYENNFGMLKSICDPSVTVDDVIKPIGEAYFKIVRGKSADIKILKEKIEPYLGKFVLPNEPLPPEEEEEPIISPDGDKDSSWSEDGGDEGKDDIWNRKSS